MPELGIWTPQEIADEIGMSRQFIIDIIVGKTKKYRLSATKKGRTWLISESEAKAFIERFQNPQPEWYTINTIAKAIRKSHKYVKNALTDYGDDTKPRLVGEKRGDQWKIAKDEAERFISAHENTVDK